MYMWRSKYLKAYGEGHIFVEASCVEKARELVIAKFEPHVLEHRLFTYEGWEPDEDDIEREEEYLTQLMNDISVEPER